MPFLIFLAVIIAGAATVVLLTKRLFPGRGPITPIVRISLLDNEEEADLQRRTLTATGIWSQARGGRLVPYSRAPFVNFSYSYEIWVKEEDADRARAVLGIGG